MTSPTDLAKLVPGFDFLQGLMKNAGNSLPSFSQWIAPTLDPDELEKRIDQLRTVQFWLEQNARMLATTIQALEVQRMTLTTLKTMNLPITELRKSLEIKLPEAAPAFAPPPAPEPEPAPAPRRSAREATKKKAAAAPAVPAGVVDPMQWWGALTKQFTELATNALKESTTDAAKNLAGAVVKQSIDAAGQTLKKAAGMPAKVAAAAVAPRKRAPRPSQG